MDLRGANGVVLITTKKGEKGNVLKLTPFIIHQSVAIRKKYDMLDGVGYAQYQNEAWPVNNANSDPEP